MERIPILKMGRVLLVSIQVDMRLTLDGVKTALTVERGMALLTRDLDTRS